MVLKQRYLSVALISGAMMILELALLRLFAVQQFYHFAFMAISLALLGAGASGSFLSLWPGRLAPVGLCIAFSFSTVAAYLVINYLPFDSFSIAWDGRQVLFLALYFLAAGVPFFFAGLLIGGELIQAGRSPQVAGSHLVYGANLLGSALGSLSSLPALDFFGGERTVVLAAALGALAGLLNGAGAEDGIRRAYGRLLTLLSIGWLVLTLLALARPPAILAQQLSPYKALSILSQTLDARHVLTAWDATARVDVVESSTIHIMPGLSLMSTAGPPPQAGLTLDGDSLMPITGLDPGSEQARTLANYSPNGLAYAMRPGGRTLALEAGTGTDALFALAAGAEQVTVVEENGLVLDIVRDRYGAFTGDLYNQPRVKLVNQSGRVYVRQPGHPAFDLLIVALTDPHRPVTSGAYSLTENYLLTVDAFREYLDVLNEDGLLFITRWLQTPPSESARTFGSIAAALEKTGRNPDDHLIAFRGLRTITVVAGRRPFSAEEIATATSFMASRGFDAVYYPGIQPEALNRFNILPEPAYARLFARILADPGSVYASYRFDIRPATDDRPFFFHTFKWRQTPEILAGLGRTWQPFGGSGFFVLVALLLLVSLASAVFILGPLLLRRKSDSFRPRAGPPFSRFRVFVYFAALGLAFLFVEVPLAQRFILLLDQPVTALAVVLFSILLFSGLGSLTVRRWQLSRGLGALVILAVLFPLILRPFSFAALGLPSAMRIVFSVLVMAPLGYLMGLPFAGGLAIIERRAPGLVPWAWAINGSFSVISSVLAVLVALSWGFPAVLWLGAAAYALAFLAIYRI